MHRETTCIVRKHETNSTAQIPKIYLQLHLQRKPPATRKNKHMKYVTKSCRNTTQYL